MLIVRRFIEARKPIIITGLKLDCFAAMNADHL